METGEKEVKVHFPLPGFNAENIRVEVTGNQLMVMAESVSYPKDLKGRFLRRERSCRSCSETVRLPVPVHGSETKAEYKNGVLTVCLPREAEHVNHRIVEVK